MGTGRNFSACGIDHEMIADQIKNTMRKTLLALALVCTSGQCTSAFPQQALSSDEVESAVAGNGADRWITLTDNRLVFAAALSGNYGSLAQSPSITILMPEAIITQHSRFARKQFLTYRPGPEETQRAVVIIAEGIALGSTSGPQCSSITRIAILSDRSGKAVAEADSSEATTENWQNGFGATSECLSLRARFSIIDVRRVKANAANGEFMVAVFYANVADPRVFKIKKRYLKKLGLN
jgi:hypothetical protein